MGVQTDTFSLKKIFLNFLKCLFTFERERQKQRQRQSMSRKGAERDRDIESKAGSRLRAVSTEPDVGLELRNHEIMT